MNPCPGLSRARLHALRLVRDEQGGITVFGLFFLLALAIFGGVALDVANAVQTRTHLQVAADSAAFAALKTRDEDFWGTPEEAKAVGLALAAANMPAATNGEVLKIEDISFGRWDAEAQTFERDDSARGAVLVSTRRAAANGNSLGTYLLRLVGVKTIDLSRDSVFVLSRPGCFREGFVAEQEVDLQSGNSYQNGFCIHSNDHVSLNSNNYFEAGTVVSMPDLANLDLPRSGFETNEGLREALRYNRYHIKILAELPARIEALRDPWLVTDPEFTDAYRHYITTTTARQLKVVNGQPKSTEEVKDLAQPNLAEGAVHVMTCATSGAQVNVKSGTILRNLVLVTNCSLKFEEGVALEDAVVATTSTDVRSINAPSGLRIGRDDNCATGGGAQILTLGGLDVAAKLQLYGGQIVALKDIAFSAEAYGLQGASMVAGGHISGTSNMNMGFCHNGMEDNFHADYLRMAF